MEAVSSKTANSPYCALRPAHGIIQVQKGMIDMSTPKRDIKDSVFTFLFSEPEYTKQLYLSLHPEDTTVQTDDIKLVTLENILAIGQYKCNRFYPEFKRMHDELLAELRRQKAGGKKFPSCMGV